jgi:deoxyribodipyrimidine photolyase
MYINNIGLVWLREDFRLDKNFALLEATKNHSSVCVFYLYKEKNFQNKKRKNGGYINL